MLTNGKHPKPIDPNCPHWTQQGTWRLYGVTHSGHALAMPTKLFSGSARDANDFAWDIARTTGRYKCCFLYEVKGDTL
jgi:hypothetical protein